MTLRDLFTIATLTLDARRTYQPGDISAKTGLEKQVDGTWAPPEKSEQPKNGESTDDKLKAAGIEKKTNSAGALMFTKNNENIGAILHMGDKYAGIYYKNGGKYDGSVGKFSSQKEAVNALSEHLLTHKIKTTPKPAPASKPAAKPQPKPLTGSTKISLSQIKKEEPKKEPSQSIDLEQKGKKEGLTYEEITKNPNNYNSLRKYEKPTITPDGFEQYKGVYVIDEKLRKSLDKARSKWSDDEEAGIRKWMQVCDGDPYYDIQSYLRDSKNYIGYDDVHGTDKWEKYQNKYTGGMKKEAIEQTVKNIDGAFKKTPPIGTNLVVYHGEGSNSNGLNYSMFRNIWGVKGKSYNKVLEQLKAHEGEEFVNNQYLSTAVNEKGAKGWHDSKMEVKIKVPKDKRGIFIQPLQGITDRPEQDYDDTENELLLNRHSRYKLDKVEMGKNRAGGKAILVTLTLLDDGVSK